MKISVLLILLIFPAFAFSQTFADLVILNANVRTIDAKRPQAEAIAVAGNKFLAVGSNAEIKKLIGENTRTINARGRLVIPGFNDSHVHFAPAGYQFLSVNLKYSRSFEQAANIVRRQVAYVPKGAWILGSGWDNGKWFSNELPTRELLDEAAPDNPVFIYGKDADIAWANTRALEIAGLMNGEKSIAGGEIVRDLSGKPTGILKGRATLLVKIVVRGTEEKALHIETASNYAAAHGVTSVQDVSAEYNLDVYQRLHREGKLKTRVYDCAGLEDWKKLADAGIKAATGDAFVRAGCLKSYVHGNGESAERLLKYIPAADKAGLQIAIHAIGSEANSTILGVFERTIRLNGARRDRRFRVEHAHNIKPEDVPRFARARIVASMQPALFFGGIFNDSEPYRRLLTANVPLAFGSDASMIEIDPLRGVYAAVMEGDSARNAVTVEEAVRAYTVGAAYAEFQENVKGTITVGKLADFVILSDDIFSIPAEKITDAKVLTTVVDGKVVYEAK